MYKYDIYSTIISSVLSFCTQTEFLQIANVTIIMPLTIVNGAWKRYPDYNRVKKGENIHPYWPWPEKSNNDIIYRFTVCQLNDKLPVGIL